MKLYWLVGSGWYCGGAAVVVAPDILSAQKLALKSPQNADACDPSCPTLEDFSREAIELPGAADLGEPRVLTYFNIEAP